ncbi:hypothetical protein LAZ67_6003950 [Cordylochernes scorpioides]|uniref:Uncharacterized protein n=1 Tax=Cordylochernes scorpioides TaxID=51811 RepID=A0ABY6KP78_9ARAC|nr:hypothetical protein LAZ67_6003950 [Cordylochernes scorpioides]
MLQWPPILAKVQPHQRVQCKQTGLWYICKCKIELLFTTKELGSINRQKCHRPTYRRKKLDGHMYWISADAITDSQEDNHSRQESCVLNRVVRNSKGIRTDSSKTFVSVWTVTSGTMSSVALDATSQTGAPSMTLSRVPVSLRSGTAQREGPPVLRLRREGPRPRGGGGGTPEGYPGLCGDCLKRPKTTSSLKEDIKPGQSFRSIPTGPRVMYCDFTWQVIGSVWKNGCNKEGYLSVMEFHLTSFHLDLLPATNIPSAVFYGMDRKQH